MNHATAFYAITTVHTVPNTYLMVLPWVRISNCRRARRLSPTQAPTKHRTMTKLAYKSMAAALACCAAQLAWGQVGNGLDNLDWAEEKEPPPPAFSKTQVLPLDMPNYVSVRVGIDPTTVKVGLDGVVRYVAVMSNATGTVNAVYEGIRCASDQVKTYARAGNSGEWTVAVEPPWRDVNGNQPSKHAFVFARLAACDVRVANRLEDILRALQTQKNPRSTKPSFD